MEKDMKNKIYIYDTTLRDGIQRADISFSVKDKLELVERFDGMGIDYIEVGFPASNPKEMQLFRQLKRQIGKLKQLPWLEMKPSELQREYQD